jgi:hypothetical protein
LRDQFVAANDGNLRCTLHKILVRLSDRSYAYADLYSFSRRSQLSSDIGKGGPSRQVDGGIGSVAVLLRCVRSQPMSSEAHINLKVRRFLGEHGTVARLRQYTMPCNFETTKSSQYPPIWLSSSYADQNQAIMSLKNRRLRSKITNCSRL